MVISLAWAIASPPVSNSGKAWGIKGIDVESAAATSNARTFPSALRRTTLSPGTAVRVIFPPGDSRVPAFTTVPANNPKLFPGDTAKLPVFTMLPGFDAAKLKLSGDPIKSPQEFSPKLFNSSTPKPIPVAVVAMKSPGTLRLAVLPKIIPAGLIKKRLESPPAICNIPLM